MNYDVEQALRQKVDNYLFHNLEGEIRRLKDDVHTLEQKVSGHERSISNLHEILLGLIMALENDVDHHSPEFDNIIISLKGYL